jgi:hypothetical protein
MSNFQTALDYQTGGENMPLFKRPLLFLVLQGRKTQTRRTHKHKLTVGRVYCIRSAWFEKSKGFILITRRFAQRLGDISPEDARKEGFNTVEEFVREWEAINGKWTPGEIVTVYEFELVG